MGKTARWKGRGIDSRVREAMGLEPFRDDLLASARLGDRSSSNGYLNQAEGRGGADLLGHAPFWLRPRFDRELHIAHPLETIRVCAE